MPNRLSRETSPYLLQHADNPVDWHPWGPEALERARREDRPILLSIGYAACHWCHVMAHESFEDEETARLMNRLFVNIKVDREERPDIDSIYMQAVQAMTGQGGWPMTMFLTPEGVPYYGGTYFPPDDRHGIPSFRRILTSISAAYHEQRARVDETVAAMRKLYDESAGVIASAEGGKADAQMLDLAFRALSRRFDDTNAGFDGAPKFPPTMALEFLLRFWARGGNDDALRMVRETFIRMARGGIHDQIGGGFARYSVDARWLVPHFEKMLYDNALLIRLGARLFKATRDAEVRRVTEQTIEWARREMLSPEGGFYSSYDADSEGEEGRYYVWSESEVDTMLGNEAALVKDYFGVSAQGNFEGYNILNRPVADEVAAARHGISVEELRAVVDSASARLLDARTARVPPGRDDKIITAWNGLMVRALFEAGEAFDNAAYSSLGVRCAGFLFGSVCREETDAGGRMRLRVSRTFSRGEARISGFLEDYASLGLAAVAAYQCTLDETWLQRARGIAASCVDLFWVDTAAASDSDSPSDATGSAATRPPSGSFYDTASGEEALITRPRDVTDNAVPSGTSLATELLLLIGEYYDDAPNTERAASIIGSHGQAMLRYPTAFGHMLCAADTLVNGTVQIAIVEPPAGDAGGVTALRRVVDEMFIPARLLAGSREGAAEVPLVRGKTAQGGQVTAYLCRRYLCDSPTSSPAILREQIERAVRSQRTLG